MTRADVRKEKYHMLIESGFDGKYATRFKNFSIELVKELCSIMNEFKPQKDNLNNQINELDHKVFERIKDLLQRRGKEL